MNSLLRELYDFDGKDQVSRVNTTLLFARLNILKGLVFETKFNYQTRFREKNTYPVSSTALNFASGEIASYPTTPSQMSTVYKRDRDYQLTFDNVLRYGFDIHKDHSFNVLVGHNEYYFNYYEQEASKKGLVAEGIYIPDSAGEDENKLKGKNTTGQCALSSDV